METAVACIQGDTLDIVIRSDPVTTIYNVVDNSINFFPNGGPVGETTVSYIESSPVTSIDNIVDNSVHLELNSRITVPINIFIANNPTTTIYNIIDNSVNLAANGADLMPFGGLVESGPMTSVLNFVDNSVDVTGTNAEDPVAAAPEPGSLSLLGIALTALILGMRRARACAAMRDERAAT